MGTRSIIAIQLSNETDKQVYCHWDGGISHNGIILFKHYQDVNKINSLISKGDMSKLGTEIDLCNFYDAQDNYDMEWIEYFYKWMQKSNDEFPKWYYRTNAMNDFEVLTNEICELEQSKIVEHTPPTMIQQVICKFKNSIKSFVQFVTPKQWETLRVEYYTAHATANAWWGWGSTRHGTIKYRLMYQINQFGGRRTLEDY